MTADARGNHMSKFAIVLIGRLFAATLAGLMVTAVGAHAQSATAWPTQRIRAIVAIGPGSAVDIIGRQLFTPLADALGQPIIVENRTGAGGTLGAAVVAKADPDGYTVLVQSSTLAL